MTNCCIRVARNSIFLNFVHSSGKYSAILAATRHGGETLAVMQKTLNYEETFDHNYNSVYSFIVE
jgi:hypothetical protein